ncbi:MAG: hypothetical protein AB7I24_18270 [Candidatus Nanopelagicales bacterium]
MTRTVISAAVRGRTAALRPVRGCERADIVDLVARAGITDYRRTTGSVIVGASRLPDVEAVARMLGVVVVRTKTSSSDGPAMSVLVVAPSPPAVAGVHACAGPVCRVPGCRAAES